jgi:hypothetical protein
MLQNIPTHVIAGPLGAGKTSLIRHLLAQRPANERWAVLINEFGQIGLDAALLSRDDDGIAIGEVAAAACAASMACRSRWAWAACCARRGLTGCLSSLPGWVIPAVAAQLGQAPWAGVLTMQPLVMVLDAQALAGNEPLPEAQAALSATARGFQQVGAVDEAKVVDN